MASWTLKIPTKNWVVAPKSCLVNSRVVGFLSRFQGSRGLIAHSFQPLFFHKTGRFFWLSGGFLERRIPGKNGEGNPRRASVSFFATPSSWLTAQPAAPWPGPTYFSSQDSEARHRDGGSTGPLGPDSSWPRLHNNFVYVYIHKYVHIYIYTCTCMWMCIYIYI